MPSDYITSAPNRVWGVVTGFYTVVILSPRGNIHKHVKAGYVVKRGDYAEKIF